MNEELDAIAAIVESWQASREVVRQRAAEWVNSRQFMVTFYDNAHIPANALSVLTEHKGAKEAKRMCKEFSPLGEQSDRLLGQYRELGKNGQVFFSQGIITNPGFRTMPENSLPCLFLVSREQDTGSVVTAGVLASALGELYVMGEGAEEHPKTLKLLRDDEFRLFRRRSLPPEETSGFRAMLLDVQMRKSWMPPDTLPFVPLLMSPEQGGAVVQIPWYIVMGKAPSPADQNPGMWHEIAEISRKTRRPAKAGAVRAAVSNGARGQSNRGAVTSTKRPFSLRLLTLRILSVYFLLSTSALIVFVNMVASKNFESGFLGGLQSAWLEKQGIPTWDAMMMLEPGFTGEMTGRLLFKLVFLLLAAMAAFWRWRKTSIFSYGLLTFGGLGAGGVPLGSITGLVLSCIPGRSRAWEK